MIARALATALLALAAGVVGIVAQADTPRSDVLTFIDDRDGLSLTVETSVAAADAGHFVLRVPDLGNYVGDAGPGMRLLSPTSLVIRFAGEATLRPAVRMDGTISGTVRSPTTVRVELQAQIDPAHRTAQATLRDGPSRYHLVASRTGQGDLSTTIQAVEKAIVADDPVALYSYLNGDTRAAYSVEAFASAWRDQGAGIGRVTAMRSTAVSSPQTNELGFVFVTVDYEVERLTPSGSSDVSLFEVFYVREGNSWKLLFSRAR